MYKKFGSLGRIKEGEHGFEHGFCPVRLDSPLNDEREIN